MVGPVISDRPAGPGRLELSAETDGRESLGKASARIQDGRYSRVYNRMSDRVLSSHAADA